MTSGDGSESPDDGDAPDSPGANGPADGLDRAAPVTPAHTPDPSHTPAPAPAPDPSHGEGAASGARVALVSARAARDLDDDLAPLLAAFARLGATAEVEDWDDPDVDWSFWSGIASPDNAIRDKLEARSVLVWNRVV